MTDTGTVVSGAAQAMVDDLRARILFTLKIYPKVSPSMLQVVLGTSTRPAVWHPILDSLIEEDLVEKIQVRPPEPPPSGRDQVYTVIQLKH